MNKKTIVGMLFCLSYAPLQADFGCQSFFYPRPQGLNRARLTSGTTWLWDEIQKGCLGRLAGGKHKHQVNLADVSIEYQRTFHSKSISRFLFGCNENLVISGSRVVNRGDTDLLADYFGLPTDFKSIICFDPSIQNSIIELDILIDCNLSDYLYFRFHTPIVNSRWNLHACELIEETGTLNYPAGYMASELLERNQLTGQALDFFRGNATWGDMQEALAYGKIGCQENITRLSDLYFEAWYDIARYDDYFFSIGAQFVVPTGVRPDSRYLFEPIIGNGRHYELGPVLAGYYSFYDCPENGHTWGVAFNASITHLFTSYQHRSFDFCTNGTGSRYMLLEDMGRPTSDILRLSDTLTPVVSQYHSRLIPAINATTLNAEISVDVQADVVVKVMGDWCNWHTDCGYELWARSAEKLHCHALLPNNRYALKGDAQLYGFAPLFCETGAIETYHALNATQSNATIHKGQGDGNANLTFRNLNADNAAEAFALCEGEPYLQIPDGGFAGTGVDENEQDTVSGSLPALLLSNNDINCNSSLAPQAISHKLFGFVSYSWNDLYDYLPFVGVGGSGEVACQYCNNNGAVSQWGVWLKAGFVY